VKKRILNLRCTAFVFVLMPMMAYAHGAVAASMNFVPVGQSTDVQTGDTIAFDVVIDFSDEPTLGGSFDVVWDASALEFVQLDYIPLGEFTREPDLTAGQLFAWGFGDFAGVSGVHVLGTLEFVVLPTMGSTTSIEIGCSGLQSCFFFSSEDFVTPIDVEYGTADIRRVPLPASGPLLLAALACLRRRR